MVIPSHQQTANNALQLTGYADSRTQTLYASQPPRNYPMTYRTGSKWNDVNELRALAIFKSLQEQGFPRGEQRRNCLEISSITGISPSSMSAKVRNYKSVAGINRH